MSRVVHAMRTGPATRRDHVLAVLAVVASCMAMVLLARQADGITLDYEVGIVPALVPWATACLTIGTAVLWWSRRLASSATWPVLLGALVVLSAWSVVMLPFDVLRLVGLVPLPLSTWGAGTRLVLLVGGSAVLVPALVAHRNGLVRCSVCGRVLPGTVDRLPRWPVAVAVVAAAVYPTLRLCWALGGTLGTVAGSLHMDGAVAWGTVGAGAATVVVAVLLLMGRGPLWVRALLGLGGAMLGLMMATVGGLGAVKAATMLVTEGLGSVTGDLMTWTFVVVYSSWFVAGVGIMVGGWRYWAHRRDACSGCGLMMDMS